MRQELKCSKCGEVFDNLVEYTQHVIEYSMPQKKKSEGNLNTIIGLIGAGLGMTFIIGLLFPQIGFYKLGLNGIIFIGILGFIISVSSVIHYYTTRQQTVKNVE